MTYKPFAAVEFSKGLCYFYKVIKYGTSNKKQKRQRDNIARLDIRQ